MAAPNASPWTEISQSVQQTMGQAGIKVSIEPMELKAVIGQYRGREAPDGAEQLGSRTISTRTPTPTPSRINDDNCDTPKIKPLAWRNKWFIPDITKEMLAAAKEVDTEEAQGERYAALQKKVTDEGPYIFMFQNDNQVASRATATGFNPGITEDLNFFRTIRKS